MHIMNCMNNPKSYMPNIQNYVNSIMIYWTHIIKYVMYYG